MVKVKAFLTLNEEELTKLLEELEKARRKHNQGGITRFCISCMKTYEVGDNSHDNHITTFTDIDHDGISEWIKALKYIKRNG